MTPFIHMFCSNPCPFVWHIAWLPGTHMQLTGRIRVNTSPRWAENWRLLISKVMKGRSSFLTSLLSTIPPSQVAPAVENKKQ